MNIKMILKMCVDIGMTIAILMLMAYSLIGEQAHEWIGCAMFVLFLTHHVFNIRWCKNLFKGKYTVFRVIQTMIVLLMLCCMIGSMVSGIILSRHVFVLLNIEAGSSWARTIHMLCGYWGFVIMSLHLGMHWHMIIGMARKIVKRKSVIRVWCLRVIALVISIYGIYAFYTRQLGEYLFLKSQFVFFDFTEPLIFFYIDYLAIMGLFVCVGYYVSKVLRKIK